MGWGGGGGGGRGGGGAGGERVRAGGRGTKKWNFQFSRIHFSERSCCT